MCYSYDSKLLENAFYFHYLHAIVSIFECVLAKDLACTGRCSISSHNVQIELDMFVGKER